MQHRLVYHGWCVWKTTRAALPSARCSGAWSAIAAPWAGPSPSTCARARARRGGPPPAKKKETRRRRADDLAVRVDEEQVLGRDLHPVQPVPIQQERFVVGPDAHRQVVPEARRRRQALACHRAERRGQLLPLRHVRQGVPGAPFFFFLRRRRRRGRRGRDRLDRRQRRDDLDLRRGRRVDGGTRTDLVRRRRPAAPDPAGRRPVAPGQEPRGHDGRPSTRPHAGQPFRTIRKLESCSALKDRWGKPGQHGAPHRRVGGRRRGAEHPARGPQGPVLRRGPPAGARDSEHPFPARRRVLHLPARPAELRARLVGFQLQYPRRRRHLAEPHHPARLRLPRARDRGRTRDVLGPRARPPQRRVPLRRSFKTGPCNGYE